MVSKLRAQRIAERIHEVLSQIILFEIADPRLVGTNITDVKVDRELAYANIYVSTIEGSSRASEVLEGLEHAKGYLRFELSQRIELRSFPQLRFHWDPTFERAERIEQLIDSLHEEQPIQSNGSDDQQNTPHESENTSDG